MFGNTIRRAGLLAVLALLPTILPAARAAAPPPETPCCCRADGGSREAEGPCRMCHPAPDAHGQPILRTCAPEGTAAGPVSFAPLDAPRVPAIRLAPPVGRIAREIRAARADFAPAPFSPPPRTPSFG